MPSLPQPSKVIQGNDIDINLKRDISSMVLKDEEKGEQIISIL
jgi:hypothetical protein